MTCSLLVRLVAELSVATRYDMLATIIIYYSRGLHCINYLAFCVTIHNGGVVAK